MSPNRPLFNRTQLARRAWPILTAAATHRHTITYGALANALGIHHRTVRFVLREVQNHCLREKLPPLTILVQSRSGELGAGFIAWDTANSESGRQRVYAENWNEHHNPFDFARRGSSPDKIASDLALAKLRPDEVYARVKVRGMAQIVFRKALLQIYGGRCAFSGDGGEPLLQAAHIVPWSRCEPNQRLDPRNGLLLSVQNHRMFDLDWIRITENYQIRLHHAGIKGHALTADQRAALASMDGRRIRLPAERSYYPSPRLIRRRYSDKSILRELRSLDA